MILKKIIKSIHNYDFKDIFENFKTISSCKKVFYTKIKIHVDNNYVDRKHYCEKYFGRDTIPTNIFLKNYFRLKLNFNVKREGQSERYTETVLGGTLFPLFIFGRIILELNSVLTSKGRVNQVSHRDTQRLPMVSCPQLLLSLTQ